MVGLFRALLTFVVRVSSPWKAFRFFITGGACRVCLALSPCFFVDKHETCLFFLYSCKCPIYIITYHYIFASHFGGVWCHIYYCTVSGAVVAGTWVFVLGRIGSCLGSDGSTALSTTMVTGRWCGWCGATVANLLGISCTSTR